MAGTFPGVSGTQQQGINGEALAGCILSVFTGGTQTLCSVYQDITLLIPGPNPMSADQSGRLPLFFVADGTYRVRLTDTTGSTANGGFDYLQVPSIGASSGGGGGTPVDQTTVMTTGDMKFQPIDSTITGWVRMNGRTIGSATSGASEFASSTTDALFSFLWTNFTDAVCPVSGGRGGSAAADFAANKTIGTVDMRFRAPFGLDTMGNSAAGRSTGATFSSGNASTAASFGGEGSHTITVAELPAHTHANSLTDPTHTHTYGSPAGSAQSGGGTSAGALSGTANTTGASATGVTITNASVGGGTTHNNMPPFITGSWFMKL